MRQINDCIKFEYRSEVQDVLNVIDKYWEAFPKEKDNNSSLKELYHQLDAMDMAW